MSQQTDVVADYERATDDFAAVLARVDGRWDASSPCEDWTALDVVEHVLNGAAALVQSLGGELPEPQRADETARFDALRAAVAEAARWPGVLDRTVQGPLGGDVPAAVFLGIIATDTLIHTWDLARALGEHVELDADLLHRSWQNIVPMDETIRRPGVFGPKVPVGPDATPQQQALAFFGRDAR